MAAEADSPLHLCAQCGAEFTGRKRKYCGARCRSTAGNRRQGLRPWAEYVAAVKVTRTCPECKQEFTPTRHDTHNKGPQVYCSVECRYAESRRASAARQELGQEIAVLRSWGMGHGRGVQSTKYQRWGARARSPCCDCGRPVGVARTRIRPAQRCDECASVEKRRLKKHVPTRRAYKSRRRALERGLNAERFDPFEVFERDGWRCHLCRCKTPQRLRGSMDDRAPELDHIVPLAAGGEHSRRNTACACRKCNQTKGAEPRGQLRLIG